MLRLLASLGSALSLGACAGFHATGSTSANSNGHVRSGSARVERREVDDHPPITLVVRLGDPSPAVAFASAHDRGSVASVALSALLLARLQAHGVADVVSVPSPGGVELAQLCPDRAAAQRFVAQISAALATPVSDADPALSLVHEHLAALKSRGFSDVAEAQIADCSGELGLDPGAKVPDVRSASGRAELEAFRRSAFASRASAFAALGSTEFVNGVAADLEHAPAWPSGDAARDDWPTTDLAEVGATDGARRLSVALRVASAEAALASLPELSTEHGALSSRLRTFLSGFTLDRVAFQARPRGACVRVDLRMPDGDPGPTARDTAEAASIVSEEIRAALPDGEPLRALDENVIEPSDPRLAALRAAWRALAGREEPGPERRLVAAAVHPNERAAYNNFAVVLSDFEQKPQRAALETRLRVEPGQGELWVLLGSPCGTLGESNDDVGQSALALTLAARAEHAGVSLEPWLTTDAVGLLAHSARNPTESATQQAERVARALAQSLTERDIPGDALALAQNELLAAAGGAPRPGYARLLDALAPDHVAWLEPRGTWASLALANHDSVSARLRDLLRGPLRVAVLGNEDDAQAHSAARALERWFAPWRDDARRCQVTAERAAHSGELSLAVADDANSESAYVGIPFASRLKYDREGEAFLALLNETRGPLATALDAEHLNASARAQIVGGGRAAALVVEIHASDDDARKATLVVRGALERLITSSLSNDAFATVQRAAERRAQSAALDPRRRIVDLWRGNRADPALSPSSLRAFQAALGGSAEVVVSVTHRD